MSMYYVADEAGQVSYRTPNRNTSAIFGKKFRKHGNGRVVTIVGLHDKLVHKIKLTK